MVGGEKERTKVNKTDEDETLSGLSDLDSSEMDAPKSKPKKTEPDPKSDVMQKLNAITKKLKPNRRLNELSANKAMKNEQEKQEREARDRLYRSKVPGLRNLENFRDSVCPKSAGFVEREITAEEYFQHMLDVEGEVPGISVKEVAGTRGLMPYETNIGLLDGPRSHGASQAVSPSHGVRESLPRHGFGGRSSQAFPAIGSKFPSLEPASEMGNEMAKKVSFCNGWRMY